jgi:stage II sporulation protein P
MYDDSSKAKAVCKIDGENAAQIMILAGTDAGGADFPHWRKNLSLALKIAEKTENEYPGIMRSVALRGASYNQQYTDGSLLIEIGTDGNTLSEAKRSGEFFAKSFAKLIKGE